MRMLLNYDTLQLSLYQFTHFRNYEHTNFLSRADSAHAIGSLHIVSEHHVLAQSQDSHCIDGMLNVHSSGVDLVIESKPSLERNAALICADGPSGSTHQYHLFVIFIQKHHSITPRKPSSQKLFGNLQIRISSNKSSSVDEGVVARSFGRRNSLQNGFDAPIDLEILLRYDGSIQNRCKHHPIIAGFVITPTKLFRKKVTRSA
mmetsp:Transcript_30879/g.42227  ORF Transcript_30879/g.42227 Transcript_30879/m.42227 type:complete len:203 (-) Transcript_30879:224-832(-)